MKEVLLLLLCVVLAKGQQYCPAADCEAAREFNKNLSALVLMLQNDLNKVKDQFQDIKEASIKASPEHEELILRLKADRVITSNRLFKAMMSVDMSKCIDTPSPYSYGMSAFTAKIVNNWAGYIKEGDKVLFIANSPSCTPLWMALMVGRKGSVVAFTDDDGDEEATKKDHAYLLDSGRLKIIAEEEASERRVGYPAQAPYDVVFVYDLKNAKQIKEQIKPEGIIMYQDVSGLKVMQKIMGTEGNFKQLATRGNPFPIYLLEKYLLS